MGNTTGAAHAIARSGDGIAVVPSLAVVGGRALPVEVEVQIAGGVPGLDLSCLGPCSGDVARRVAHALRSGGYELPRRKVSVNIQPRSLARQAAGLDLAILVGVLAATGQVPSDLVPGHIYSGELGIAGSVEPMAGEVPAVLLARDLGLVLVGGGGEGPLPIESDRVRELVDVGNLRHGTRALRPRRPVPAAALREPPDFADVPGCDEAKRALAIAVAGGHGILIGNAHRPSYLASTLAMRVSGIMPRLEGRALEEALAIHSAAGDDLSPLARGVPPLRAVEAGTSLPRLLGGGRPVRPGEVSLAHGGALVLDGLEKFNLTAVHMVGRAAREGLVDIRRMGDVFTIPASFLTVATASAPDPSWTPGMYRHYIDSVTDLAWELGTPMVVNVVPGPRADTTYSTAELSSMVERAREFAAWRRGRGIDDGPRSVARTIADMDWSEGIEPEHEREAALYERSLAHPHGSPRGDDGALGSSLEAARAAAEALDQAFRDPRAARSDAIGRE